MKGLFPSAQFGAQQINASNSRSNNRNNTQRHTPNEEIPILCSRCAEPVDDVDIDLKTWLAVITNIICITLMCATALLVKMLQPLYSSDTTWNPVTTPFYISIALFYACAVVHITVSYKLLDMSLSRMVGWGSSLGSLGCVVGMMWCTIWFPHLRKERWAVMTSLQMWGILVALVGVYVVETVRVSAVEKKDSTVESSDEKMAL